ncbi:MAG: hypothetical protein AAF353_09875 [Pseudomonadota bacterium]
MRQSGNALIIFLLALMSIGGVGLASLTQEIRKESEQQKFLRNQQVLKEAKEALLMYAYRYPEIARQSTATTRGPGRLPCPDTDDDGIANPAGTCEFVGRFPWNQPGMNFRDIRDATDERLWYAITGNFRNSAPTVNSATSGGLTLYDQNGEVIYDGAINNGIAAVIFAPGGLLNRDHNDDGIYEYVQIRNTAAQQLDARNYLDTYYPGADTAFDNSLINDGESDTNDDGVILGPVFDQAQNITVINDQMIIVTVDEVLEVAQRAVLDAYNNALDGYRANVGVDAYPWLDDYTTNDLTVYDGDVGTRLGRLPSMFGNYFIAGLDDSETITSNVNIFVPLTVNGFDVPSGTLMNANAAIRFNTTGDLIITPSASGAVTTRYFWDEFGSPDGWEECLPRITFDQNDCNQAAAAPGVPDGNVSPNEVATRVVRVTYDYSFVNALDFTRAISDAAGPAPSYVAPTTGTHAEIFFEYAEAANDEIDIDFFYDDFYLASFDLVQSGSNLNYQLGVIYYPELADWVLADEDGWHNTLQFAFSEGFEPDGGSACNIGGPAPACLTVNNTWGTQNDKVAVLTLAADDPSNFLDDSGTPGFQDELADIFDIENDDPDGDVNQDVFDLRAANGNDDILIIR